MIKTDFRVFYDDDDGGGANERTRNVLRASYINSVGHVESSGKDSKTKELLSKPTLLLTAVCQCGRRFAPSWRYYAPG